MQEAVRKITLPVVSIKGEKVGEREALLILIEKENRKLLHRVIVQEFWNRLPRTAKTKTRGEVRGGGRKPWRQKGTGRARHGSIRSPLWRGGGVVFGPQPNFRKRKVNKKERRKALRLALEEKMEAQKVALVRTEDSLEGKTKEGIGLLKALSFQRRGLVIYEKADTVFYRAMKNIDIVRLRNSQGFLLTDLVSAHFVLIEEKCWENLYEKLWKKSLSRS